MTPEVARRLGVHSITERDQLPEAHAWAGERAVPSIAFPWTTPGGETFVQLRPDAPVQVEGEREGRKYLWPAGCGSALGVVRESDEGPVFFVEGTKQSLAGAAYLPEGAVYAIAGCRSWSTEGVPVADLDVVEDREVVLVFDADLTTNLDVWTAASRFTDALRAEGATAVRYVVLAAGRKAGLDDVLGGKAEEKRAAYLARVVGQARSRLGGQGGVPKPEPRRAEGASTVAADPSRPMVAVNGDQLEIIEGITAALRRRWDGTELFNFGNDLVRRGEVRLPDGTTMPVLRPQTEKLFFALVAEACTTVNISPKGEASYAPPGAGPMGAALAARLDRYTPLDRLALSPFVRADGTICQAEGYDPASRTYLAADPALGGIEVPDDPTAEDVAAAVKLLCDEWLGDLFAIMPTDADRANALALMLTPLVRGLVPIAPLAVVNGLQMGVGKNLFADMLSLLTTGRLVEPLPYNLDDAENRKVITTAFKTGAPLFVFDEAHRLDGGSLTRALTAPTWKDRELGGNTMANYPNNVTWVSLGNNVELRGDVPRRVYVIRLQPTTANPQDRSVNEFRHSDLRGWTAEHRGELLRAALLLVRAWFAAGRPVDGPNATAGARLGSFDRWAQLVGGVLDVAGVPDFLGNLQKWRSESDHDRTYWLRHLSWLDATFGTAVPFTVAQVVRAMKARPDLDVTPPGRELSDPAGASFARELGKAYAGQRDKVLDGLRLIRVGEANGHHGVQWAVDRTVDPGVGTQSDDPSPDTRVPDSGGTGGMGGMATATPSGKESFGETVGAHETLSHVQRGAGIPPIPPDTPRPTNAQATPGDMTEGDGSSPDTRVPVYGLMQQDDDFPVPAVFTDPGTSPVEHLLAGHPEPVLDGCPDCDGPLDLVPPGRFWRACRSCTPGTFARD